MRWRGAGHRPVYEGAEWRIDALIRRNRTDIFDSRLPTGRGATDMIFRLAYPAGSAVKRT